MTPFDKLRVLEAVVLGLLDRMEREAEDDPKAAARFVLAKAHVTTAVTLYRYGPGNPVPAIPAYAELGGEA